MSHQPQREREVSLGLAGVASITKSVLSTLHL